MAHAVRRARAVPAKRIDSYVTMSGGMSGGTVRSGIVGDTRHAHKLSDPFLLGGEPARGATAADADPDAAEYEPTVSSWVAPFGMARINTRVVRRSVGLLRARAAGGEPAGEEPGSALFDAEFRYSERALAPSEGAAKKAARAVAAPLEVRERLVKEGRLPRPGEGPSAEERAKGWFAMHFVGEPAADGHGPVRGTVSGGDPGYEETAKMVSEAAVMLATQRGALAERGGVHTPASAFGLRLQRRLHESGISFVLDDGATPDKRKSAAPDARAPASKL